MATYLDLAGLQRYDTNLKAFLATQDAEVLARAGVSIELAATPTAGSAATYVVYQNYTEAGDPAVKTKTEIGKIEIPLDRVVESGSLVTTAATETAPAKAEIVLVLENTVDATTTSGKKEVVVDISAVAGDIASVTGRVDSLETAMGKNASGELISVADRIKDEAADATYTETETIGEALARFEDDITYAGTVATLPAEPKKGALYNVVPAEGAADTAPKGWKFWDGTAWQSIDDPTLTERTGVLETQVGKDKTVTVYEGKSDLVDIMNLLTSDVTVDGSILEVVNSTAADGIYGEKEVEVADENGVNPGEEGYIHTTAKQSVTIKEAIQSVASEAEVTLKKNATATDGYFASYHLEQNGAQVGDTINIPKDFLVKSADIKVAPEGGVVDEEGAVVVPAGHRYIDFVVNTVDDDATEKHIYLDVLSLVEDFTVKSAADNAKDGNEVQLAVSDDRELSAALIDATISRAKIDSDFEADLAEIEAALGATTDGDLYAVTDRIKAEAKDAVYKTENGVDVTIADVLADLEGAASVADGAFVLRGKLANKAAIEAVENPLKGDGYVALDTKTLYVYNGTSFEAIAINGAFTLGNGELNKAVDIKTYIDSRIFVGTQEEVDTAMEAGTIDDTTFVVVTDDGADELTPIEESTIDDLFK